MTWQGKRRKQLPGNWGTVRKQVLERDGYRCTAVMPLDGEPLVPWNGPANQLLARCTQRATEVDHHEHPDDHRLSSLRSLCHTHHAEKTQREAKAAQAKVARKRQPAKHPGLR